MCHTNLTEYIHDTIDRVYVQQRCLTLQAFFRSIPVHVCQRCTYAQKKYEKENRRLHCDVELFDYLPSLQVPTHI